MKQQTTSPPAVERLQWVLHFAQLDLGELQPGALFDLANELQRFTREAARELKQLLGFLPRLSSQLGADGPTDSRLREVVTQVQQQVQAGLEELRNGRVWQLPAVASNLVPLGVAGVPKTFGIKQTVCDSTGRTLRADADTDLPAGLGRQTVGTFDQVFVMAAADVLLVGWPSVRICASSTCKRLFVPADPRQKYCSRQCGQQAQWARFAPRRKARDYRREYDARIARLHGRKVRVQRRKKTAMKKR